MIYTSENDAVKLTTRMSNQTATAVLEAFLTKANEGEWDLIHEHVQPVVTYNGKPETRDEFTRRIADKTSRGDVKLRVDGGTTDEAAKSLAGRLIATSKDADGTTLEVWDMILFAVEHGKIARFYHIQSQFNRHPRGSTVPAFTTKPSRHPLSAAQLQQAYTKYIHDLNARCIHTTIADHFAEEVVAGGQALGHTEMRGFFVNLIQPATTGLQYTVEEIVVDAEKQQLAVKLSIQGDPENERVRKHFGGVAVKLDEIAMYGFTDGKISIFCAAAPSGLLPDPPAP